MTIGLPGAVGSAALAVVAVVGCAAIFRAGRTPTGAAVAFSLAIVTALAAFRSSGCTT